MNTKKANRDEVRDNSVVVPLSQIEKDKVKKRAQEIGVTMAAFVRMILNRELNDD